MWRRGRPRAAELLADRRGAREGDLLDDRMPGSDTR